MWQKLSRNRTTAASEDIGPMLLLHCSYFFSWNSELLTFSCRSSKPGLVAVLILRWHMKTAFTQWHHISVYIYIQIHKNIFIYNISISINSLASAQAPENVQTSHCILYISYLFQDCVALCACLRIRKVVSLTSDQEIKRCQDESGKETSMCEQTCHIGAPFKSKKPHRLHYMLQHASPKGS